MFNFSRRGRWLFYFYFLYKRFESIDKAVPINISMDLTQLSEVYVKEKESKYHILEIKNIL